MSYSTLLIGTLEKTGLPLDYCNTEHIQSTTAFKASHGVIALYEHQQEWSPYYIKVLSLNDKYNLKIIKIKKKYKQDFYNK